MPGTRDHDPLVIEEFNGLWDRGDPESAPSDHFIQADNIQFFHSGFETRDGLESYLNDSPTTSRRIIRIYNYITQNGKTLLVLDDNSNIYHITGPTSTFVTPILTISGMTDFGFVAISGRAYITPFKDYVNAQGERYQLGIQNEFLYVYKGDGTPARKAAGNLPVGTPLVITDGAAGLTDTGFHLFSVVYETDTGFLTAPGTTNVASHVFTGLNKLVITNVPVSPDSFVTKRHIVATKEIIDFNGDKLGYQFFFVPNGTIPNNTATTITVEFFDSDLISDASHLIDNFAQIPSGVSVNTYHSRLVLVGEFGTTETLTGLPPGITDNRSIARVSFPGEPESISRVDGLIIAPLDGKALTNVQEFRDVLYLFKNTRTIAYSDNFDVPASWQEEVLDQGIGAPVHGIGTVLDTGGVNIDFLLIADWSGLVIFNGTYAQPSMTWKIERFWRSLDRNSFNQIQIANDSLNKKVWITIPFANGRNAILHADYSNGMTAKDIRWAKWIFNSSVTTLALTETDKLVIGTFGVET
jgi:hypothetical protein